MKNIFLFLTTMSFCLINASEHDDYYYFIKTPKDPTKEACVTRRYYDPWSKRWVKQSIEIRKELLEKFSPLKGKKKIAFTREVVKLFTHTYH